MYDYLQDIIQKRGTRSSRAAFLDELIIYRHSPIDVRARALVYLVNARPCPCAHVDTAVNALVLEYYVYTSA